MTPENTHIIFGPPGTGKTHALLDQVDLLLEEGYRPREIAFLAFTRKAANEAKNRAVEKFNLDPGDLPWFRTIHSLVFERLGLTRNKMMGFRDYLKICEMLALFITFKGAAEDGTISGLSKGDRLFFMESMARATMTDLKKYWENFPDEDIYWYELERLRRTLKDFKELYDKRDFTDMLEEFLKPEHEPPPIKILIVDEAQDLTKLQWSVVEKLSTPAEEVYIGGDDDQAIFRWAGADVDHFMNLPGDRRVLPQSYRVPEYLMKNAQSIIMNVQHRVPKVWKACDGDTTGDIIHVTDISQIDMSAGSWYLLGRNTFLLKAYNEHCMMEGFVFSSSIGSPVDGNSLAAIKAWEELRKGQSVKISEVKKIYDLMTTKIGVAYGHKGKLDAVPENTLVDLACLRIRHGLTTDEIWHVALDKMSDEEREYFIAALRRGEKLLKEPRIKINTIHGVKGGEADHVVIQLDMADRTYKEYEQNPDDEHRVWYVACTRARKSLTIIQPRTKKYYEVLS